MTWCRWTPLDVRPLPGVVLKHYTARDVLPRWDIVRVYTRATTTAARGFLDQLLQWWQGCWPS